MNTTADRRRRDRINGYGILVGALAAAIGVVLVVLVLLALGVFGPLGQPNFFLIP